MNAVAFVAREEAFSNASSANAQNTQNRQLSQAGQLGDGGKQRDASDTF